MARPKPPRHGLIHIGTSGWHYPKWIGDFYPSGSKLPGLLEYYHARFGTVELNNSFYRLPSEETLAGWKKATPRGFLFTVKASRYITHNKKLKDGGDSFRLFFDRVATLGVKLGPILFQLPPQWGFNGERLEEFLSVLPKRPRYVFEFRHPSWFQDRCYELLDRFGAGFCQYHWNREKTPEVLTGKLAYLRFHGTRGKYGGSYSRRALEGWAKKMSGWASGGRDVFAYFNNDSEGAAPWNALTLKELL